jgi:membrane protein DedA with SNARE-associated domain/rhodanese-related sulfurtransferase
MDFLLAGLSQHGYSVLFVAVLLEAIGFPVPAAIALLLAGGASAGGILQPALALSCALLAMMLGDTLMFLLGRYTGWWLLGLLCRVSLNPESCILRSADSFYERGRWVLVLAKFVPGMNTMAPPLAGSMNMRLWPFLGLDFAGTVLYVSAYFGLGYVFSDAIGGIRDGMESFGNILRVLLIAAIAAYIAYLLWAWLKSPSLRNVPRVLPQAAAAALERGTAVVYDTRSHGYYDAKAMRIRGSRRLEPNALNRVELDIEKSQLVFLYCTCVREATAALVARELIGRGLHAAAIKGGLQAWKKAGLPLEAIPREEMAILPGFDL